ncbi:MAG TPA: putative 4-mercaptohistidine N1-methyltransferase [Opitutales bacterium]|nr:putative 4-mercaptohistidine N1-methyltransferase [Opitutales bacterium]
MSSFYESISILEEYLLFHYGSAEEILPYDFGPKAALDFSVRCVRDCFDLTKIPSDANALDLGCAVGRSTFELAAYSSSVLGIDFSQRFIEVAKHLQADGEFRSQIKTEGALRNDFLAKVPPEIDRTRVKFEVGDATDLPREIGSFDLVLMANLIDRLPRPALLLERLPDLVRLDGQLVLVSPYTWMEEFTPRSEWLGGFEKNGQKVHTFEALQAKLSPDFELAGRRDLPFLIREHARKFQWSVAEATTWIRRG